MAAGRFERVPILNGIIHDEERVFISASIAVTGAVVPVPQAVTAESYQHAIASVLDVPAERAAAIAAEYPLEAHPSPTAAVRSARSSAGTASRKGATSADMSDHLQPPLRYPPAADPRPDHGGCADRNRLRRGPGAH